MSVWVVKNRGLLELLEYSPQDDQGGSIVLEFLRNCRKIKIHMENEP